MADVKKSQSATVTPSVEFTGEQDGAAERDLKSKFVAVFSTELAVERAYLAKISVGGSPGVALCLFAPQGNEEDLVDTVSRIFAATFKRSQHLDILFLDKGQLAGIAKVCHAFYPVQMTRN